MKTIFSSVSMLGWVGLCRIEGESFCNGIYQVKNNPECYNELFLCSKRRLGMTDLILNEDFWVPRVGLCWF